MEWSIAEVSRATGVTSRTLRHYGDLGLLVPSRVAPGGVRHYDRAGLVRLQRILLLRDLGLGLTAIAAVLDRDVDEATALREHLAQLRDERGRLERRIASVTRTLDAIERTREEPDMADMFDGFDHTQYRDEVAERWGSDAARRSADWWERKTPDERRAWQERLAELNAQWRSLAESGADPAGVKAQSLAQRHADWVSGIPGTPAADGDAETVHAYVRGLGDMYVADDRFAAIYGGVAGAAFVRDALASWADAQSAN